MSISERIQQDVKAAMKSRDQERLQTLRMVLSGLQLARKEAGGELDEAAEIRILAAEKKKRQQAADGFRQGGREESALKEEAESALIDSYLPRGLDEAELAALVEEGIAASGAVGVKEMGAAMSAVMALVAGRADGKAVSELVRQRLLSG
ncbi:MAG: GatB/YqeY domain-containing protein [Thermoleophilia bacterium]